MVQRTAGKNIVLAQHPGRCSFPNREEREIGRVNWGRRRDESEMNSGGKEEKE